MGELGDNHKVTLFRQHKFARTMMCIFAVAVSIAAIEIATVPIRALSSVDVSGAPAVRPKWDYVRPYFKEQFLLWVIMLSAWVVVLCIGLRCGFVTMRWSDCKWYLVSTFIVLIDGVVIFGMSRYVMLIAHWVDP